MGQVGRTLRIGTHVVITAWVIALGVVCAFGAGEATPLVILDDARLRLLTVIGSTLGALLQAALYPDTMSPRQIITKLVGAVAAGYVSTPLAIRYMSWAPDADVITGVSAGIAVVSTITIHRLLPYYEKWLDSKLKG